MSVPFRGSPGLDLTPADIGQVSGVQGLLQFANRTAVGTDGDFFKVSPVHCEGSKLTSQLNGFNSDDCLAFQILPVSVCQA